MFSMDTFATYNVILRVSFLSEKYLKLGDIFMMEQYFNIHADKFFFLLLLLDNFLEFVNAISPWRS